MGENARNVHTIVRLAVMAAEMGYRAAGRGDTLTAALAHIEIVMQGLARSELRKPAARAAAKPLQKKEA